MGLGEAGCEWVYGKQVVNGSYVIYGRFWVAGW